MEIGYELDPAYWGEGIATQALSMVIQTCFKQDFPIKLNRITATTHIVNPASIAVLKKLGFEEEVCYVNMAIGKVNTIRFDFSLYYEAIG